MKYFLSVPGYANAINTGSSCSYVLHTLSMMAACIAGASSGALSLSANVATFTVTVCYNCISLYAVSIVANLGECKVGTVKPHP